MDDTEMKNQEQNFIRQNLITSGEWSGLSLKWEQINFTLYARFVTSTRPAATRSCLM